MTENVGWRVLDADGNVVAEGEGVQISGAGGTGDE